MVRKVPVTVDHAQCDLAGVTISYLGYGGATVPSAAAGLVSATAAA
jgi:hypothetical protein